MHVMYRHRKIDGATLDRGKSKFLKSDSNQYIVTCAVSFEFKACGVSISSCSVLFVRFSGAVRTMLS